LKRVKLERLVTLFYLPCSWIENGISDFLTADSLVVNDIVNPFLD